MSIKLAVNIICMNIWAAAYFIMAERVWWHVTLAWVATTIGLLVSLTLLWAEREKS